MQLTEIEMKHITGGKMRTQEEILQRIESIKDHDFFGWQTSDLIDYLDYSNAQKFLKPDVDEKTWEGTFVPVKQRMIEYMEFAWEKANNKRGISASRTMDHYKTWLWLDGAEKLSDGCDDYEFYGKPQLIEICKYLGIDSNQYDYGMRENE
jgi:hypothetical protein